jgi:hemerythrin-like domain-containing protein
MKPTDQLKEEHLAVKQMLKIMGKVSLMLEAGQRVDSRHLESIIDFIQVFVDKCHHGKEEGLLFPAMVEAGIPEEGGPIGVMLTEHDLGRSHVKKMVSGIDGYKKDIKAAASIICENANGYIQLLEQHIYKEDNILYPMADESLSLEKQNQLLEDFEKLEQEVIGAGKHAEFHKTLRFLQNEYLSDAK